MIVGVDVDGVLACFFKAYEDLTVKVAGVDLFPARYPAVLPPTWDWPEHYGYSAETMKEVWRQIKADTLFWKNLDPLPGAVNFLKKLYSTNHEVYFITDRAGNEPQFQTHWWLQDQGFDEPNVIISRKGKGSACTALSIELYIDDKGENVLDVMEKSPETRTLLLTYPYNKHIEGVERIEGLEEVFDYIPAK